MMAHDQNNGRSLLTQLGIGGFNATMIIQYLFVSPFTTDPKSPMIMILVQHLQNVLNQLGAGIAVTGGLDRPTANALDHVLGKGWINYDWADVITGVLAARKSGFRFPPRTQAMPVVAVQTGTSGIPILDSLPDVPGGALTYLAGAALLWHTLKKKRKA